jgi:hypothetical protein
MPDATPDEADILAPISGNYKWGGWGPAVQKQFQERPTRECLLELAAAHHALPTDKALLAVARGADLATLVAELTGLTKRWQEEEDREAKRKGWLAQGKALGLYDPATGKVNLQFPGQAGSPTTAPAPEPAPQPDEEESPDEEPEPEEKAEYEYELELTGDLTGLIEGTRPLTAEQLPLAVADLARALVGHPITKDSSLLITVYKK